MANDHDMGKAYNNFRPAQGNLAPCAKLEKLTERQSARMSKIKNGLDQYGAEPFEQQQFGTAGVEEVSALTYTTLFDW